MADNKMTDPAWDKVRDYDTSSFKEEPVTVVPGAWDKEIADIEEFLVTMDPGKPVKLELNQLVAIQNAQKYVERELEIAKEQNGNPTYRPYLDRALAVVRQLKRLKV